MPSSDVRNSNKSVVGSTVAAAQPSLDPLQNDVDSELLRIAKSDKPSKALRERADELLNMNYRKGFGIDANVNAIDKDGSTSLHYALEKFAYGKGNIEFVKLLLKNGANLVAKNNKGFTPYGLLLSKDKERGVENPLHNNAFVLFGNLESLVFTHFRGHVGQAKPLLGALKYTYDKQAITRVIPTSEVQELLINKDNLLVAVSKKVSKSVDTRKESNVSTRSATIRLGYTKENSSIGHKDSSSSIGYSKYYSRSATSNSSQFSNASKRSFEEREIINRINSRDRSGAIALI